MAKKYTRRETTKGAGEGSVKIGLAGPGVRPSHFDVVAGMEFFHSFIHLMKAIAENEKVELKLSGMQLGAGSVALRLMPEDSDEARRDAEKVAEHARLYIARSAPPPPGVRFAVGEARRALTQLPDDVQAFVEEHGTRHTLPTQFPTPETIDEQTELRLRVRRVGGKDPKVVAETSPKALPHDDVLYFATSEDIARKAAPHLYSLIDATVVLSWLGEYVIDARLVDFVPVAALPPAEEARMWREWFARAGKEWDDVDDIEDELKRGRS